MNDDFKKGDVLRYKGGDRRGLITTGLIYECDDYWSGDVSLKGEGARCFKSEFFTKVGEIKEPKIVETYSLLTETSVKHGGRYFEDANIKATFADGKLSSVEMIGDGVR